MKRLAFLFWLLAACKTLPAQEKQGFPQSFTGHWKGTLQWIVAGKPTREFLMRLVIQPADTAGQFTWHILYGDSAVDSRPYILRAADTGRGKWVIDERDGIILDSYLHGNCLHGAFTVQENTIVDNYCVEGNRMQVEFFSIKLGDKHTTGKGTADTPFVDNYTVSSYQFGSLFKE